MPGNLRPFPLSWPLSRRWWSDLVSRVPEHRFAPGVRVGLVLAAATGGALVGLGWRHGAALAPFLAYGRSTLALVGLLRVPLPVALVAGVAMHTVWMILWGVCFTVVAAPLRTVMSAILAVTISGLIGLLSVTILPGAMGAALGASLSAPQRLLILMLVALSLVAGTRLARQG